MSRGKILSWRPAGGLGPQAVGNVFGDRKLAFPPPWRSVFRRNRLFRLGFAVNPYLGELPEEFERGKHECSRHARSARTLRAASPLLATQRLTKPEHLATWLCESSFEGRSGGFVELKTEGGVVRGVVSRWEPPRRLVYSWLHVPSAERGFPDSMLSFELEPRGQEVVLVLTHRRVSSEFRSRILAGWHVLLDTLRARLEGKQEAPSMETFQRFEREYEQSPR